MNSRNKSLLCALLLIASVSIFLGSILLYQKYHWHGLQIVATIAMLSSLVMIPISIVTSYQSEGNSDGNGYQNAYYIPVTYVTSDVHTV